MLQKANVLVLKLNALINELMPNIQFRDNRVVF